VVVETVQQQSKGIVTTSEPALSTNDATLKDGVVAVSVVRALCVLWDNRQDQT
jgi:hypothetical protein